MTVYAIFSKPEDGPEAIEPVPDRFVWAAALVPPLWALARGAWSLLLLWILTVALLSGVEPYLGGETVGWLYLLFALWCGFAAPGFAMRTLMRRGWIANGDLVAGNKDMALARWLALTYGGGR